MEKDIDRIPKNADTDIVIRIDDFGGKIGVTIREFVKGERYTGFTKAGTRIPADKFSVFKQAINSIDEKELIELSQVTSQSSSQTPSTNSQTPSTNSQTPSTNTQTPSEQKEVPKKNKKVLTDEEYM